MTTDQSPSLMPVSVPEHALRVNGNTITQLKPSATGEPSPISMVAVSGAVLDHWYWGPMTLDPAGAVPRQDSIPLDWQHDYEDSIGYLDAVQTDGHQLTVSGQVVPYPPDPHDIATKVLFKSAAGVPYQCSVDFSPMLLGDIEVEFIRDNQVTQVGGRQLSGPLTVFRKWPLNAVALCTHGYDAHTSAQLTAGPAERTFVPSLPAGLPLKEFAMSKAPADAPPATPPVTPEQLTPAVTPPATPPTAPAQLSFTAEQLSGWQAEFGSDLALALLTGKHTPDSARLEQLKASQAQVAALTAKVGELENRLKAAQVGDKQHLSPDPEGAAGQPAPAAGDNHDQLTAAINAKLPASAK